MPKYFNIVKLDVEDISEDTVVYLVKTSNRRFTLQAYSTSEFDQMRADPITRENIYWRISQECLPNSSHPQAYNAIFPEGVLRTLPLSVQQVKEYLSVEPIVAGLNEDIQEGATQIRRIDAARFNSRSLSSSHSVRYFDVNVTLARFRRSKR
jgi:hypothetical protein